MFPVTSRYHNIETTRWVAPNGREVVYLRRRFLPDTAHVVVLVEHAVAQGERLDNITAQYLGDPEQFWRLCDANNVMDPSDLADETEIGRRLNIPLLQGG